MFICFSTSATISYTPIYIYMIQVQFLYYRITASSYTNSYIFTGYNKISTNICCSIYYETISILAGSKLPMASHSQFLLSQYEFSL
jgi:hypothetical protein